MKNNNKLKKVTIIGGGVIGSGWVARCLLNGIDVTVFDPNPNTVHKIKEVIYTAQQAFNNLIDGPVPARGQFKFVDTIAKATIRADLIIEAGPERLEIKRSIYRDIEMGASPEALVTSSTSGLLPTDLQAKMIHPERFIVAHPFNPVYLLPLVELVEVLHF